MISKSFLPFACIFFAAAACDNFQEANQSPVEKAGTSTEMPPSPTRVAFLVAEGFHDGEAFMPMGYLNNHGCEVVTIGIAPERVGAYNSDFTIDVTHSVSDAKAADFDALVLPGGKGPAVLRENEAVLNFVREFWESGKPVAAICHGPQVLISAGLMEGRTSTGVADIKDELTGAGANYKDEALVTDGQLITSRTPDDLPQFAEAIAKAIQSRVPERRCALQPIV